MCPLYVCPPATAIPDISTAVCLQDFGQIQKAAFMRQYASAGVKNEFTTTGAGDIKLLASWTAYLAAAAATKVQVTPEIENPVTVPGAAKTVGGGNATLGGITKNRGSEPTSQTYDLNAYNQAIIAELKEFQSEFSLGVFLFNQYGQIGCLTDDIGTPTAYYPIPIAKQTFFIGDKKLGGLDEEDMNLMTWQFMPGWSDYFVVVSPTDFSPLTDLVNP